MNDFIEYSAFQCGIAPLVVGLVVGGLLWRTRFAWLAVAAAYATLVALTTGFVFTPLSASRKILLLVLIAPVVGLALDHVPRPGRAWPVGVAGAAGASSLWAFWSILVQREANAAYALGAGVFLFVAALTWATVTLREDGVRAGAAGVGLGVGAGVAAVLSASLGFFMGGIAFAAGSGALLLVQVMRGRAIAPGYTGTLTIAMMAALFAAGAFMLAQLPWYVLPMLLAVPAAVQMPRLAHSGVFARTAVLFVWALLAAALPIAAAWFATRGS